MLTVCRIYAGIKAEHLAASIKIGNNISSVHGILEKYNREYIQIPATRVMVYREHHGEVKAVTLLLLGSRRSVIEMLLPRHSHANQGKLVPVRAGRLLTDPGLRRVRQL
jgi:hypothetical protein